MMKQTHQLINSQTPKLTYAVPLLATLLNLLLLYVVYFIAHLAYIFENWNYFSAGFTWDVIHGMLVFDTSAILVTNIPYILMMLFPLHWKENIIWHRICKWEYMLVNGIALASNLVDAVYFPFTMRRTTTTVFREFQNESNLVSVFLTECVNHWYFILLACVILYIMWRLYTSSRLLASRLVWWKYDLSTLLSLAAFVPFIVAGIRGGFSTAVRPITISNALQYVDSPTDAAFVLNTPFSIYRTIGKDVFELPHYFASNTEMERVYTPIHVPSDTIQFQPKNVVVLIVESFGREYIGALNKSLEGGTYQGYTPNVDSLIRHSITFSHSYCNGRKSIDGMPSILSSIPMFVEPFILTPASMNKVSGIASLLADKGYQTAFFHGAQRGSMGFQAFARSTGFQEYYGREDFNLDKRFGDDRDFDGTWAIWDEPFLQYYCTKMSDMKQPFMTAVFTASSHHPYHIPDKYKDIYPDEELQIHKCIRYTDMAIGRFFDTARQQSWYNNTIFVLTSDHTNQSNHAAYQTDLGGFASPIIIFEPGNTDIQPEVQDKIAQQIDILPTVMGMMGYDKPYCAFGQDLLNTTPDDTWAVNYLNGIYQYVKHNHVIQFDGHSVTAAYHLDDSLMQHNVKDQFPQQQQMETELKAIIQQYMQRMLQDQLTPQ